METNESIIEREVMAINEREKIGKIKGFSVDCNSRAVSDLIVESESGHNKFVLPFDKTVSIGDSFVVIESRDDLRTQNDSVAKLVILGGFPLVGTDVFSRTGNQLGKVQSFKFDEIFGTIDDIAIDGGTDFDSNAILFFTPEYVFVDNGQATSKSIREQNGESQTKEKESLKESGSESMVEEAEAEAAPVELEEESTAELRKALLGAELREDVESDDGEFKAKSGEKIDEDMLDKAEEHDALVLLTMSVDL